jgi:hypothetical protein
MLDIKRKLCMICDTKRPSFNKPGEKVPTHCSNCKEPGMVDIENKKCIVCNKKRPMFNKPEETKGTHCADCKEVDMIDVVSKMCVVCNKKHPRFIKPGEKPTATHCNDCKEVGMIDIKSKMCIKCNKKRPTFNKPDEIQATHCGDCKDSNMVNVKDKKCVVCNKKVPVFNKPGEIKATHCFNCKDPDMLNIKDKKCVVCNIKLPSFNKIGEKERKYCGDCKESDMINVACKKCIICNIKVPIFKKPGQISATHCFDCKDPDMIANYHKCLNCNKVQPSYGYIGQSFTHCGTCAKKLNYIGLFKNPKTLCQDDCKELAIYGVKEPIHCEEHTKENEICLIVKKCKGCNRDNMLLDKNDLCVLYCKPNSIYQQAKREKKKENLVLNYLNKFLKKPPEVKVIDNECLAINLQDCNRRLPDRAYDCGTHFVIIEVDENQHKGYSKEDNCELVRMHQIYEVVGLPCIFLRFNPDNYRVKTKLQKVNMSVRLDILTKWVQKCLTMSDIQGIHYKFLYYDEYEETDLSFHILNDLDLV